MSAHGRTVALEVAVTSPAGARAAREGGADRVELCTALELGGLTPSQATIERTVGVGLAVHVLVRPRGGGFVHDQDEVATVLRDVAHAVRAGASGVVVGALTPAGALDEVFLVSVVDAARSVDPGAEVTLHRAIDQLARPSEHVAGLALLGLTRVLTSGGAACAPAGTGELTRTVAAAAGLQVMAGGGVTPESVEALVATGVAAVHLSAKRSVTASLPSRVAVGAAAPPGGDAVHWVTDRDVVAATRAALDAGCAAPVTAPRR